MKKLRFGQKATNVLRGLDSILQSVVIFVQTFVERLAGCMNTIAETFTGFGAAAVFKLPYTLRQSVARLNAVKVWNDHHKKDNGGKNSGSEKSREFIVKKLFEKNAEPRIK